MLSDRYFQTLYVWINYVACPLGATPFKLDLKRKRMYTTYRAQKRCNRVFIFLIFNNLLLVGMMIYFKHVDDFNQFNHAYLGWVLTSIWCICVGSFALHPQLMCYMFNAYVVFFDQYKDQFMHKYNPNTCKINKRLDVFLVCIRFGCCLLAILEFTHFLLYSRESPFYLEYYIPKEYYCLPLAIWSLWMHFSIFLVTSINLGISACLMVSTTIHAVHIIAEDLRCGIRNHKYRTLDTLRTGRNMRIAHRSMEILCIINLEIGAVLLYPMDWLIVKMVVFCGANLIKYHEKMEPIVKHLVGGWALFGIVIWGFCLELAGYMNLYSQKAINSWKYHDWGEDHKVMSKFRKSCRPMKISYHKIFTIKRLSVLKFFRKIAKALFKAFVAL